jgi:hypothetical protein
MGCASDTEVGIILRGSGSRHRQHRIKRAGVARLADEYRPGSTPPWHRPALAGLLTGRRPWERNEG